MPCEVPAAANDTLDNQPLPTGSILFQSNDSSVVLLDVPRSLEESQVLPGHQLERRILSNAPPTRPFATPEPKDGWPQQPHAAQLAELMTAARARDALHQLAKTYTGPFHLDRIMTRQSPRLDAHQALAQVYPRLFIPAKAKYIQGSVQETRGVLLDTAPRFKLIVIDPPWPNRSARRRRDKYATVHDLTEMRDLLLKIPVNTLLAADGLVAVWITNKHDIPSLLTSDDGVFAAWGLELVIEWTWLKITSTGHPLLDLDSLWRKPWERLFIAKRRSFSTPSLLKSKIIMAVPDEHSRKPNLRAMFHDVLGTEYQGLEVFARNLTAGWWSWGSEVLRFQHAHYWLPISHREVE
ncbi:hypothetical protein CDD81_3506 [Ophiocordyceps australis]|uniref:MT-A70 family n=1 Tax=Ophiocordyceps australis TaxID=1399860 RepID=A0A2C5XVZ4_9HYPO|nr:hypothetical protein CDD81_3506 [Ophiocordyceps australis]